jgi:hypothetical protein
MDDEFKKTFEENEVKLKKINKNFDLREILGSSYYE